jgi:hypothetical protein
MDADTFKSTILKLVRDLTDDIPLFNPSMLLQLDDTDDCVVAQDNGSTKRRRYETPPPLNIVTKTCSGSPAYQDPL